MPSIFWLIPLTSSSFPIEVVNSDTLESNLFRLARLTWSVPVSQGYGRRMRFLVWDDYHEKLMGIFALGDPVFNLKVRDEFIGWNLEDRKKRLVNVMDAYILGALPPYNMILGGKLIASLVRTRDVRALFSAKYSNARGIISDLTKKPSLVLVSTSSSLGRSSIYNRLKLDGVKYFQSLGFTSGWGHFHIPDSLFEDMRYYLKKKNHHYATNHQFGDGPNWRLRTIRACLDMIGMNSDLLKHGICREVFISRLAMNAERVLRGEVSRPCWRDLLSVEKVAELAKDRWVVPRAKRRKEFRDWEAVKIRQLLNPSKNGSVSLIRGPKLITNRASRKSI
ncbi:Druantia anti-phage system protein DruA [Planctomycetota bacterium]